MSTLLAFLLVIGPLIFFHELGHFLVAKWRGVRVERFSLGYPPRLFGFRRGGTDYCVSAVPLGGHVKMAGDHPDDPAEGRPDEFAAKSAGSRALIIAAGPVANWVLAFLIYVGIIWVGGDLEVVDNGLRVGDLKAEWPAQMAGLQTGDLMLAVNGEPLSDFESLRGHVGPSAGEPVTLTVLRNGDTLQIAMVPRSEVDPQTGEAQGMIGLAPMFEYAPVGLGRAAQSGAQVTWNNTVMVTTFFGRLLTGRESPRSIGGPLFIASIAGQVADRGWRYLFGLMALLSINLVILNILPIPVLDGGQLLFILIETARGGPLSLRQRVWVQQIGLAFLFVLIIFVTINDIMRVLS